jgi:excinuclease ABC subunit C
VTTTSGPHLDSIRESIRAGAKNCPGVYRMIAPSGLILYVGKSKRLRTRLMGYPRARSGEKAWRIIREARSVEWEYTPSEFASLLRELELIRKFRPPYNVHRKWDGLFSFLKLTPGAAPALDVVRRINGSPGVCYGPFRGGQRIAEAVRELNDVLQLRDCGPGVPIRFSDQEDLWGKESGSGFGSRMIPLCARPELGRCLAPCAGGCSESVYTRRIEQAWQFLTGDGDGPVQELTARMEDASLRMEFEHAARLRDRIERLLVLRAEFLRMREVVERLTFLYPVPGHEGDHRVYVIRAGSVLAVSPAPGTPTQRRRLIESFAPLLRQSEVRKETTSSDQLEQILLVTHWFRVRPDQLERAVPPDQLERLPLRKQMDRMPPA